MPRPPIYLDNNATTRIDPAVLEAMLPWLGEQHGNPSSSCAPGRLARQALEKARLQVAGLIGARETEIVFTGSGTESIHTAILAACAADPQKKHVVTSAVEHSATLRLCEHLARSGHAITRLPVDRLGRLDPDNLRRALRPDSALVSLLWANNETGVLFPVAEIAAICREARTPLHLDAVQAVGKVEVDVATIQPAFLSLSGHKLHAPKGVGALYANRRVRFEPLLRGSQERERRGGTENVAGIVALGVASEIVANNLPRSGAQVGALRDEFERIVLDRVVGTVVNGDPDLRLPNTSNLAFAGVEAEGLLLMLDNCGLYCSAGSACTAGAIEPSHVLVAMGMDSVRARSSLRFSFGRLNSDSEARRAAEAVAETVLKLRRLQPGGGAPDPTAGACCGGNCNG